MTAKAITVTGVGLITANGASAAECWDAVVAGHSGIDQNTLFDTSGQLTPWAGMVKTPQDPGLDRCYSLARTAVREALAQSGLVIEDGNRDRIAIVVGSSLGAVSTLEQTHRVVIATNKLDAEAAAYSQLHCVADFIAAEFDVRGQRVVTSNACAAGAVAVGYAAELLWFGDADYVICGGVDPLAALSANGFTCLGALDSQPCSPMAGSTGLTLGEGAGFMLLERADTAAMRQARALAEIAGYGTTCDGYHQTAPDPGGNGAVKSMRAALLDSGVNPDDVDYVNLHGTGTPTNDAVEPKALRLLFEAGSVPPTSSTKAAIGHTLGAAGAVETIFSILSIENNMLPPTINTRGLEMCSGLDIVAHQGRAARPDVVLTNSFAFGGNNASVVVTRPGCRPERRRQHPLHEVVITAVAGLAGSAASTDALLAAFASGQTTVTDVETLLQGEQVPVGRLDIKALARWINPAKVRRMDPLGAISCAVVADLYSRFGKLSRAEAEDTGVIFATGYGPVSAVTQFNETLIREGIGGANPLIFPNTVVNAAAGHLAMVNRYRGYTATLACGGTSSVMALQLASRVIARGAAQRIMVVIADEFPQLAVQTAAQLPGYRHGPDGSGAVLSEGAVAVLLESADTAAERSAEPLGVLRGFGASGESVGIGQLGSDGLAWSRAIDRSLDQAGVQTDEVRKVFSAANGHGRLDRAEREALGSCGLSEVPSVATKKVWGETYGSAAGLALVAGLASPERHSGDNLLITAAAHGGSCAAMVAEVR